MQGCRSDPSSQPVIECGVEEYNKFDDEIDGKQTVHISEMVCISLKIRMYGFVISDSSVRCPNWFHGFVISGSSVRCPNWFNETIRLLETEQGVHISEMACLEQAVAGFVWEMETCCPGLTITPDGFATFDSFRYNKQPCPKWSKETIKFVGIDKYGVSFELKCTFSV